MGVEPQGDDQWLVNCNDGRPLFLGPLSTFLPLKVGEIMNKGVWDLSSIECWLSKDVKRDILGVPINNSNGDDKLKVKCEELMEGRTIDIDATIRRIKFASKEYLDSYELVLREVETKQETSDVVCTKLLDSWVNMNIDGAYNHKTKNVGIGVICQNS
ncbi:hypothetical protein GOBAR_DD01336 [Gossypium barbadense]|nr:hypothetical protein GOBAR_DD01336 [Gossypium barbadense]